jgi:hypothetical protein
MKCSYEQDNQAICWDSEDENAYHEAAHIALAAVLGLELLPDGILIYELASPSKALEGFACYREGDLNDPDNRTKVLLALLAGVKAQDRQFPESKPHGGAADIDKLFKIMTRFNWEPPVESVHENSALLVDAHWNVIEALATALQRQPWQEVNVEERRSGWGRKKQLDRDACEELYSQRLSSQ